MWGVYSASSSEVPLPGLKQRRCSLLQTGFYLGGKSGVVGFRRTKDFSLYFQVVERMHSNDGYGAGDKNVLQVFRLQGAIQIKGGNSSLLQDLGNCFQHVIVVCSVIALQVKPIPAPFPAVGAEN